jgi:AcrR family transcriptional regulator
MARQAVKSQKSAEPPLGRSDWIEAAIAMLAEDNVEALRVDTLAEKLGVTKGSFYWHFKGREDLLSGVLDAWRLRMTSEVRALIFDAVGAAGAAAAHRHFWTPGRARRPVRNDVA